MWAIIKKEVRTYFLSPIGYVFVGLFLLMASLFFYSEVLVTGSTMFSNIFYSLSTILIMIVPLLTMRTFSEERKDGTEQLLLTAPRSVTSIVLGKFFAALIVLLIAVVLTFIDDPKWVNDYAVCQVIRALKSKIDELERVLS